MTLVVPKVKLRLDELAEGETSSFGAMIGSRAVGFLEDSPLFSPCITTVVAVNVVVAVIRKVERI